jgi:hypothetical protein
MDHGAAPLSVGLHTGVKLVLSNALSNVNAVLMQKRGVEFALVLGRQPAPLDAANNRRQAGENTQPLTVRDGELAPGKL